MAKALKGAKAQGVGARVAGWLALESGAGGWLGRVQIFNSHLKNILQRVLVYLYALSLSLSLIT